MGVGLRSCDEDNRPHRHLTAHSLRYLVRVDHLAHRIQQVLHALHAMLQRDQPTCSLRHAASSQEQRVMRGRERHVRVGLRW